LMIILKEKQKDWLKDLFYSGENNVDFKSKWIKYYKL
jgi:hypothetical protein